MTAGPSPQIWAFDQGVCVLRFRYETGYLCIAYVPLTVSLLP